MAAIIKIEKVADGWEAYVKLKDGRLKTWHYLIEPTQTIIDDTEITAKMEEVRKYAYPD